jgi:hypothetical protein
MVDLALGAAARKRHRFLEKSTPRLAISAPPAAQMVTDDLVVNSQSKEYRRFAVDFRVRGNNDAR